MTTGLTKHRRYVIGIFRATKLNHNPTQRKKAIIPPTTTKHLITLYQLRNTPKTNLHALFSLSFPYSPKKTEGENSSPFSNSNSSCAFCRLFFALRPRPGSMLDGLDVKCSPGWNYHSTSKGTLRIGGAPALLNQRSSNIKPETWMAILRGLHAAHSTPAPFQQRDQA